MENAHYSGDMVSKPAPVPPSAPGDKRVRMTPLQRRNVLYYQGDLGMGFVPDFQRGSGRTMAAVLAAISAAMGSPGSTIEVARHEGEHTTYDAATSRLEQVRRVVDSLGLIGFSIRTASHGMQVGVAAQVMYGYPEGIGGGWIRLRAGEW